MLDRILRPEVDADQFSTGLYFSETPEIKPGPGSGTAFMRLDNLASEPLSQENRDFIKRYTAVCSGKVEDTADVFQDFYNRETVVTQRFYDVVFAMEPDVHEFVEIPKTWSYGSRKPYPGVLYFMNVHATLPTVDVKRSSVHSSFRRSDGMPFTYLTSLTRDTCVLLPGVNGSGACKMWRDTETHAVFMSADLVDALNTAGVRGVNYTGCCGDW